VPPILVRQIRNGIEESVHRGDIVEVDATGRVIRAGALAEPIREFTIASTIQRMLKDIAEVGADLDWLPMRSAGVSLVVHDVTMSGAG